MDQRLHEEGFARIVPPLPVLDVVHVNRPTADHLEDAILLRNDRSSAQRSFVDEDGADIANNTVLHEIKQLFLAHAQMEPDVVPPVGINYQATGDINDIVRALRHLRVAEEEDILPGHNHGFLPATIKMMRNRECSLFTYMSDRMMIEFVLV